MRQARGADVCGTSEAVGSQGSVVGSVRHREAYSKSRFDLLEGGSSCGSFCFASAGRGFTTSFPFHLSGGALSLVRLSGLLVRDTSFSLVVTVTRSVLRSSVALLVGRGFPDAVLLCPVLVNPGCGEGTPRGSFRSVLKLCPDGMRGLELPFAFALSLEPLVRRSALETLDDMIVDVVARRHWDWLAQYVLSLFAPEAGVVL